MAQLPWSVLAGCGLVTCSSTTPPMHLLVQAGRWQQRRQPGSTLEPPAAYPGSIPQRVYQDVKGQMWTMAMSAAEPPPF
jgi:hypothetical protein